MADKTTFTADEWTTLKAGVVLAGLAVTAAEPSGLIGLIQEGLSSGRILAGETASQQPSLAKAIADDLKTSEGRTTTKDAVAARMKGATRENASQMAIAGIGSAMAIANGKAPADAQAYGAFLMHIAKNAAEAASEGGFLGMFGGERVTKAEHDALDAIARVTGQPMA